MSLVSLPGFEMGENLRAGCEIYKAPARHVIFLTWGLLISSRAVIRQWRLECRFMAEISETEATFVDRVKQ